MARASVAERPIIHDDGPGMALDFELPGALEASEPPEARGLRRDEVRLLVSDLDTNTIAHARFHELPQWLSPGDLLVVNASRTLNAALVVSRATGERMELHLSTQLPGGFWSVELRRDAPGGSLPSIDTYAGETLHFSAGARATLLAPYPFTGDLDTSSRLWIAALTLPAPIDAYLGRYGFPIRYRYVTQSWPSEIYQTIFATEFRKQIGRAQLGSAEMPSAGRPFTHALLQQLRARGVEIAPIVLHAGVASLERHEPPFEEPYLVSRETADRVNAAHRAGRRVIAVGTTVVRALETVTDDSGITHPGRGWTDLVITPDRPLRSVDSLLTGLHEPRASHLHMLAAIPSVTIDRLRRAYDEALDARYLWHEFGDTHLILGRQGW